MSEPRDASFVRRHRPTLVIAAAVFGGLGYAVATVVQKARAEARRTSDA